jgi:hypothetical protein
MRTRQDCGAGKPNERRLITQFQDVRLLGAVLTDERLRKVETQVGIIVKNFGSETRAHESRDRLHILRSRAVLVHSAAIE